MPRKGSYRVKKGKTRESLKAQVLGESVLLTDDGKHDPLLNKDSGVLKPMHRTSLMLCLCPRVAESS